MAFWLLLAGNGSGDGGGRSRHWDLVVMSNIYQLLQVLHVRRKGDSAVGLSVIFPRAIVAFLSHRVILWFFCFLPRNFRYIGCDRWTFKTVFWFPVSASFLKTRPIFLFCVEYFPQDLSHNEFV